MDLWLSIEVFDGDFAASQWWRSHSDLLTEAAITNGVLHWATHTHNWGMVLEFEFDDEEHRDRFRNLPAVRAALDAVPDPVSGLLVYPGRGGGSGSRVPRRPRPRPSAGSGALPIPQEQLHVRLSSLALDDPHPPSAQHIRRSTKSATASPIRPETGWDSELCR